MSVPFVLTVSGLAREASIAAGLGVRAVAAGGDRLVRSMEEAVSEGAAGILSFGLAGGLHPDLMPGATILAGAVIAGRQRWPTDLAWQGRLAAALPSALIGDLAGVDAPVAAVADKQALKAATGALAVDMEFHIAARLAAVHGLPFAALRVVCDPAGRALPPAAMAGWREDGATDVGAVLLSLLRSPRQLPGVIRLARDAREAFASLRRIRGAVGAGCALLRSDES